MNTFTTNDIKVSVEPSYQSGYSKPVDQKFIFAYHITIENLSAQTVQLLRRHWTIVDSNGKVRVVEGEGVIGRCPILEPNETHQYVSWCPLETEIGKMKGSYLMKDLKDSHEFQVIIPEFQLIAPFILN